MASYRELKVWQAGMELAADIYRLTSAFPNDEQFGLVSQLRRAAVSIPSNLAEGHGRNTPSEMIRFASIALGSTHEVETQLLLCRDLRIAAGPAIEQCLSKAEEIGRMLHGLIRSNRER